MAMSTKKSWLLEGRDEEIKMLLYREGFKCDTAFGLPFYCALQHPSERVIPSLKEGERGRGKIKTQCSVGAWMRVKSDSQGTVRQIN